MPHSFSLLVTMKGEKGVAVYFWNSGEDGEVYFLSSMKAASFSLLVSLLGF